MQKPPLLRKALAYFVLALVTLLLWRSADMQAATQTENWCPELGRIRSSSIYLSGVWDLTRYHLSDAGLELLRDFDTSGYVQAYYGDRSTDADDQWLGAPRDLERYMGLKLQTDRGDRWLAFADSESEPDVLLGLLLLSRTVSGSGDQRGMHDICAVFTTTRAEVDALWNERVAEVRPAVTPAYYPTLDPRNLPPTVTPAGAGA